MKRQLVRNSYKLADRIIESLPEDFIDDEEMELALSRDKEMDEDTSTVLTHKEFFDFFVG